MLEVRFAINQGHWLIDDIVTLTSGGSAADTTHTPTTPRRATHAHPRPATSTTPKGAKAGGH